MRDKCIGNCLICGKCKSFSILDSFVKSNTLELREGYGIAVDIGTTSVVLALVDLGAGEVLSRHSFMNPQRAFGPDVITRISAANSGKAEELRRSITESIASAVDMLIDSNNIQGITDMVIAGNTVMTYLLLGLPCESLGVFPFKPAHGLEQTYRYKSIFGGRSDCLVRIMPWLAAFVGGDITAGLLSTMSDGAKRFMLVDLGTNGEMALYDKGRLIVTSTAAGPAFEGSYHGGGASGVLDDLAQLVRDGHVDETGLLESGAPELFSQKEIRDLQLAKSAVRSGMEILLETANLDYKALGEVYLAGGIGQAMNINSAVEVGLLPSELKGKIKAVGNASLSGAARLLLAPTITAVEMEKLFVDTKEVNLAAHPKFNDYFMNFMCF